MNIVRNISFFPYNIQFFLNDIQHLPLLETFVKYGAAEEILFDAKPHIGTDVLKNVIKNMHSPKIARIEENHSPSRSASLLASVISTVPRVSLTILSLWK